MNRRTITKSLLSAVATGALVSPGALAQRPVVPSPAASAITLVDIPGIALALSPDSTMVAGVTENEAFCVWDVATFETIAQSEPLPELRIIDAESATWSPDSSAVAWSLNTPRLMRDSDIYVFDVASATITNLTREPSKEEDAASLMQEPGIEFGVDMFPVWTASGDGILFTRTPWAQNAPRETRLMRISPEGGDATEVALLSDTNAFLVNGPMTTFEDGSVLYATWPPRTDDPDHGVFLMTPDGEIDGVSTGMLAAGTPMMMVINVAPEVRKASAVSLQNYNLFNPDNPTWIELDLDTGVPTRFEEILSLPVGVDAREQDLVLFAAPAFLTRDGALTGYLYTTADVGYDIFTIWRRDLDATAPEEIGTVERPNRDGQGVLQIPRMKSMASGDAAMFFGGTLWTIRME